MNYLDDLGDVNAPHANCTDADLLTWNDATQQWMNVAPTFGYGNGTSNYTNFTTNETANISWTKNFTTTGNITANFFNGNGSLLTGIASGSGELTVQNNSVAVGNNTILNFIPGSGIEYVATNASYGVNLTITSTAGGGNVSQEWAVAADYLVAWNGTGLAKNSTYSTTDAANWNTAYGWGDHSGAGYLTSPVSGDDITNLTWTKLDNVPAYTTSNQALNTTSTPTFKTITISNNTGLHIADTAEGHDLVIRAASELTLERILSISTGDADKTLTLNGNATLGLGTYYNTSQILALDNFTNIYNKTEIDLLDLTADDLSDNTTTDLAEGTNLYYTEARWNASLGNVAWTGGALGGTGLAPSLNANQSIQYILVSQGATVYQQPREQFINGTNLTFTLVNDTTTKQVNITGEVKAGVFEPADANLIKAAEIDTSAKIAAILTDETGTGNVTYNTSPTITTPNIIGTAQSTGFFNASNINATNVNTTNLEVVTGLNIPVASINSSNIANFSITGVDITNRTINATQLGQLTLVFPIEEPDLLSNSSTMRTTVSTLIWPNTYGVNFTMTSLKSVTDIDNFNYSLFKSKNWTDVNTTNDILLQTVIVADNGVAGCFYNNTTSFTNATIEADKYLIFEWNAGNATRILLIINGTLG